MAALGLVRLTPGPGGLGKRRDKVDGLDEGWFRKGQFGH